jgi:hypothetical protein
MPASTCLLDRLPKSPPFRRGQMDAFNLGVICVLHQPTTSIQTRLDQVTSLILSVMVEVLARCYVVPLSIPGLRVRRILALLPGQVTLST